MKQFFFSFLFLSVLLSNISLQAQPVERLIKVIVGTDHDNWTYRSGENVNFSVSVFRNGNLVKDAKIRYEIGPEKMPATKQETITLKTGMTTLAGGSMSAPGFLRCIVTALVDGKEYRGLATAGIRGDESSLFPYRLSILSRPAGCQ